MQYRSCADGMFCTHERLSSGAGQFQKVRQRGRLCQQRACGRHRGCGTQELSHQQKACNLREELPGELCTYFRNVLYHPYK